MDRPVARAFPREPCRVLTPLPLAAAQAPSPFIRRPFHRLWSPSAVGSGEYSPSCLGVRALWILNPQSAREEGQGRCGQPHLPPIRWWHLHRQPHPQRLRLLCNRDGAVGVNKRAQRYPGTWRGLRAVTVTGGWASGNVHVWPGSVDADFCFRGARGHVALEVSGNDRAQPVSDV